LHAQERFDAVINLAGAPVLGPRWSQRRRAQLLASRVGVTQALTRWASHATHKPAIWIQASAIGFYGARDADQLLDEHSAPGGGFMSELCQRWKNPPSHCVTTASAWSCYGSAWFSDPVAPSYP
jgi:NAD dependent epimerase/dehydratase family enzyme